MGLPGELQGLQVAPSCTGSAARHSYQHTTQVEHAQQIRIHTCDTKPRKASMASRPFFSSFSLYSSNCCTVTPPSGGVGAHEVLLPRTRALSLPPGSWRSQGGQRGRLGTSSSPCQAHHSSEPSAKAMVMPSCRGAAASECRLGCLRVAAAHKTAATRHCKDGVEVQGDLHTQVRGLATDQHPAENSLIQPEPGTLQKAGNRCTGSAPSRRHQTSCPVLPAPQQGRQRHLDKCRP